MEEALEHVREGAVPEVVHEPREHHAEDVVVGDPELRLLLAQVAHLHPREVRDTDRVLLPRVGRRRVEELTAAQLLDRVEPLELRRVHHRDEEPLEDNLAVDAIVDALLLLETGRARGRRARRSGVVRLRVAKLLLHVDAHLAIRLPVVRRTLTLTVQTLADPPLLVVVLVVALGVTQGRRGVHCKATDCG